MHILGNPIRTAIVDDHDAIRFGFRGACEQRGFEVLAATETVSQLIEQVPAGQIDVAVLDLSLADGSQVDENVRKLLKHGAQVLVFSIADKKFQVQAALKAGAAALVRKSQSMDELLNAITLVADGLVVNNTETTAVIDADSDFKRDANLTVRERKVLSLYASGFALKQVAHALKISPSTAKEHIDRVRHKYSGIGRPASTKTELLMRAIEDGILDDSAREL